MFNNYKEIVTKAIIGKGKKEFKNEYSLEKGIELVKKNSRNYAKRQVTYIKNQFPVTFYENMPIKIWSDDGDEEGNQDNLLADAVAIKNEYLPGCSYVKWCCKIDMSTLMHESEYKARNQ